MKTDLFRIGEIYIQDPAVPVRVGHRDHISTPGGVRVFCNVNIEFSIIFQQFPIWRITRTIISQHPLAGTISPTDSKGIPVSRPATRLGIRNDGGFNGQASGTISNLPDGYLSRAIVRSQGQLTHE
jgi:hypothetical protein